MKQALASVGVGLMVAAQAARRRTTKRSGVVVLSPPSPHKNRGDEALLRALLNGLETRNVDATVLSTGKQSLDFLTDFPSVQRVANTYPAFTSLESTSDLIRLLPQIATASEIVLVGADVVDEGYGLGRSHATLRVLEQCIRVGVSARVVSFSMNETPSENLRNRFARITRHAPLFVRDPVSIRRLEKVGISNIRPAGDLAFLLEPASLRDVPDGVAAFVHSATGPVIGLNMIRKVLGDGPAFQQRLQIIANACQELAVQDGCRFLLLPHDDHEDSRDLADVFQVLQETGGASWSFLVDPVPRAAVLKRIAGMCTHVFTCRLHLGIATLGMGRPMTGFPYQGKFEGQFELFGLSHDGLIPPDQFPTTVEELVHRMRQRIAQSESLAAQIQQRLPAVRELSLKNFEGLGTLVPEGAL